MSTWPVKCRGCGYDFFPLPDILEVAVDPRLTRDVQPARRFPKRCYEKACQFLMSDFGDRTTLDIRLVHGTYQDGLDHAWVEIGDDVVFDGVLQRFYDRASYYRVQRATKSATFSVAETAALMIQKGTWWPWQDESGRTVASQERT